jgi:signal transduction histidine kinase
MIRRSLAIAIISLPSFVASSKLANAQSPPLRQFQHTALVMATDRAGCVWVGFLRGAVKIFEGENAGIIGKEKSLDIAQIRALYDSGKEMWINSLPGVLRVPAEEVNRFRSNHAYAMHYRLFGVLDGVSGKAPQLRPFPSIIKGIGQTLWFTTTNGAGSMDTANIYTNPKSPPVSIKDVLVDGVSLDFGKPVSLPKGSQNMQINYTALSLSIPERVLFRYKLENYDKEWQEAGARRQAFYSHLPPGHYVFRVIACNNDGVWNNSGAIVSIFLPPTFLQSWYFKALIGALLLVGLWLLYLFRIKQETSKVKARLYERFSERERIARDLHDTFFQGIQGLLLSFQAASRGLPGNDPTRKQLDEALLQSDAVMLQGRELVLNLRARSRGADNLECQLEAAAIEFARHFPSEFRLTLSGEPKPLYPHVYEEYCKIGKEALCNAYRHAKASLVEVTIEYNSDFLRLSICDDGIGIRQETLADGGVSGHWGMPGMRERAASIGAALRIESSAQSGTTVQVEIPSRLSYPAVGGFRMKTFLQIFRKRDQEV